MSGQEFISAEQDSREPRKVSEPRMTLCTLPAYTPKGTWLAENRRWANREGSPPHAKAGHGRGGSAGTEWGPAQVPNSAASPLGTGSGSIDADELRTVLRSCMRESAISLPDEKLDQLTLALFESADKDCNGAITFDELRDELQRFPGVMENLTISAAHWLTPPAAPRRPRRPRALTWAYWHNHRSHLLCLAAFAGLHLLLFALAASEHRARGASVMVAKGCGQCLNLDGSFIAVLMLRRCLTWLRATWLAQVLPLDQNIQFHQFMGYVVIVLSLVHTVAHIVNFALQAQAEASPFQFWELLLTTRPGIGWIHGLASPTGVALLLLLLLMFACSSSCIRRSGHFEVSILALCYPRLGSHHFMLHPLSFTAEPRKCPSHACDLGSALGL